ncbi:MAG: hypothetical protein ACRDNY_09590 [Gaiellaceae bacterium]
METQGPASAPEKRDTPWTLIVVGVLVLYAVVIALLNSERVEVDFLFFSTNTRLLFLVFLCVGIGFVGGYLFHRSRMQRAHDEP